MSAKKAPQRGKNGQFKSKKRNPSKRKPRASAKRRRNPECGTPAVAVNPSHVAPRRRRSSAKRKRNPANPSKGKGKRRKGGKRRRNPEMSGAVKVVIGVALASLGVVGAYVGGRVLDAKAPLSPKVMAAVKGGAGVLVGGGLAMVSKPLGAGFAATMLVDAGKQTYDAFVPVDPKAPQLPASAPKAKQLMRRTTISGVEMEAEAMAGVTSGDPTGEMGAVQMDTEDLAAVELQASRELAGVVLGDQEDEDDEFASYFDEDEE